MSKAEIVNQKTKDSWTKRFNGWMNTLTNLGKRNKDKRLGANAYCTELSIQELEALYQSDDVAAKIVDIVPTYMMREGFNLRIEGDEDSSQAAQLLKKIEDLDLYTKIEKALRLARLYGGAAIIFGFDDGKDASDPVDAQTLRGIKYAVVLDRHQLKSVEGSVQLDPEKPYFNEPTQFRILTGSSGIGGSDFGEKIIHVSRMMKFVGVEPTRNRLSRVDYWGESVFARLYNPIRNFQTAHDSTATIICDFTVGVLKLHNLMEICMMDNDAVLESRLQLVNSTSSIVNSIVLDSQDEWERKTTNVTGLEGLLNKVDARLVSATEIPHTVLLGESPSGLGATGNSEKSSWYDYIKGEQESILRPLLTNLFNLMMLSIDSPTSRTVEPYTLEFISLEQEDEKGKIDKRKVQSEVDDIYLKWGVLDADEVRKSRFSGAEFNLDTQVDVNVSADVQNDPATGA